MTKLAVLMIVVGVLVFESKTYAQIRRLEKTQTMNKPITNSKRRANELEALKKLQEGQRKLEEILERRSSVPVIWEGKSKILTGKVVRGVVLNSIVSTNISSPVLVEAYRIKGSHIGQSSLVKLRPKIRESSLSVTR